MYDLDGNGWIDQGEMTKLLKSIYAMMGPGHAELVRAEPARERAANIFRQMDRDGDGRVTRTEFVSTCLADQRMIELLTPTET